MLYGLTQYQLSKTLFPLGEYEKSDIRRIAEAAGLLIHASLIVRIFVLFPTEITRPLLRKIQERKLRREIS